MYISELRLKDNAEYLCLPVYVPVCAGSCMGARAFKLENLVESATFQDSQRSTSGQKVLTHSSTRSLPLSMCEIRRLKRGVATIGHNWATILRSHRFAPGRTAEELREKWRVMNRKKHM